MGVTILALIGVHGRERMVRRSGGNGKVGKLANLDPSEIFVLPVERTYLIYYTLHHLSNKCRICAERNESIGMHVWQASHQGQPMLTRYYCGVAGHVVLLRISLGINVNNWLRGHSFILSIHMEVLM
jgi:hypothetical protein